MIYDKNQLDINARENGFMRDTFEKVVRLNEILSFLNKEPVLKNHLLLKGGTAINLTIFNLPRLSVDIDMDYMPCSPKEDMLRDRELISTLLISYMQSEGYMLSATSRYHHSLDSLHFRYNNSAGNQDLIKIEINYSLRAHILESENRTILNNLFSSSETINCVAPMEIFASKTVALLTRTAARDFYDCHNMIKANLFSDTKDLFRKIIVFYASLSSTDPKSLLSSDRLYLLPFQKIRRDLFPVLNKNERHRDFELEKKMNMIRNYLDDLLDLPPEESEYLKRMEQKEYTPELLFDDEAIIERIKCHPMALWKCR